MRFNYNSQNESNIDSNNSSALSMVLAKILGKYKCYNLTVLVGNQILSINENGKSVHSFSFKVKSANGLNVEIITKFVDKVEDNPMEIIPLIRFQGIRNYVKVIKDYFPPIYCISVEDLKMIYLHLETGITKFTIPEEDLQITIPITLDGIQIEITMNKVGQNQYVISEIDI